MAGRMGGLMRKDAIEFFRILETRDRRHMDEITLRIVIGLRLGAGADIEPGCREKAFQPRIGFGTGISGRLRSGRMKTLRQAVDLIGIEDTIAFEKGTRFSSPVSSFSRSMVPYLTTLAPFSPLRTCPPAASACL